MAEQQQLPLQDQSQRKLIRFPDVSKMTADRAPDETGTFTKSDADALKIHKVLSPLRPFSCRSREEIMEFVCYMYEVKGSPGEQICCHKERNCRFYFVASGELLIARSSGSHSGQLGEHKLFELDHWGLESLFVGKDERVTVTVTAACRLYVLTARRFFWLCKMCAERTFKVQQLLVRRLAMELPSVRECLDIDVAAAEIPQLNLSKANLRKLDGLLHLIRQVQVPTTKEDEMKICCNTGQSIIVYVLSGCAELHLGYCLNYLGSTLDSKLTLMAGDYRELLANQMWYMRQVPKMHYHHTIAYLIKLKLSERSSESTAD